MKKDWAVSLGGTAAGSGVAKNMYPAKYTFNVTLAADCANDFVVFPINSTPTAGQANIAAFNQLYRAPSPGSGLCGTGNPATMWAYQVGSGPVKTSPVLSLTGAKVAFVESQTNASVFHVLTWTSGGTVGSPATPGSGADLSVNYAGATNTNSSPVFTATAGNPPAVKAWVSVASTALTGPVFDPLSIKVFVSDGQAVFAYTPGASSFTLAASPVTLSTVAGSIKDPAIVDVVSDTATRRFLYVFTNDNGAGYAYAIQIPYTPSPFAFGTRVDGTIGDPGTYSVHSGAFSYDYNGAGSGSLYVCGNQGNGGGSNKDNKTGLYRFTFLAGGAMNASAAMGPNKKIADATNDTGECAPLTAFYNSGTDRLFVGAGLTTQKGAAYGPVRMWILPVAHAGQSWDYSASYTGGLSGIVVDNTSASAQASSIYFGTLNAETVCGSKVCAIKLTQSALQ